LLLKRLVRHMAGRFANDGEVAENGIANQGVGEKSLAI
jgi:hypothetical protein